MKRKLPSRLLYVGLIKAKSRLFFTSLLGLVIIFPAQAQVYGQENFKQTDIEKRELVSNGSKENLLYSSFAVDKKN